MHLAGTLHVYCLPGTGQRRTTSALETYPFYFHIPSLWFSPQSFIVPFTLHCSNTTLSATDTKGATLKARSTPHPAKKGGIATVPTKTLAHKRVPRSASKSPYRSPYRAVGPGSSSKKKHTRRYDSYRPSSATLSLSARRAGGYGRSTHAGEKDAGRETAEAVRDLLRSIASPPPGDSTTALAVRQEEKKEGDELFGFGGGATRTLKVQRIYGPNQSGSRRIVPYGAKGTGIGAGSRAALMGRGMAPPPPRTPAAPAGQDQHHVHFTTPAPPTGGAHIHLPSHKTPYPGRGNDIVAPTSPSAAHGIDAATGAVPDGHVHFQFNPAQTTELSAGKHDLKDKGERLPHDAHPGNRLLKQIHPGHSQPLRTPKHPKAADGDDGVRYVGPPETPRDPRTGEAIDSAEKAQYGYSFTPSKPVPADEITDAVLAEVAIERSGVDAAAPFAAAGKKKVDWDFDGEMLSPSKYQQKHKMSEVEGGKKKPKPKGTPHPKKGTGGGGALPFSSPPGDNILDKARRTAAALQKAAAPPAPAAAPAADAAADMPAPPPSSDGKDVAAKYTGSWGSAFALKPGQWRCDACRTLNEAADTEKCLACEAPKAGATPAAADGAGGSTTETAAATPAPGTIGAGGFSFGAPPPAAAPAADAGAAAAAISTGGFSFGATAPAAADAAAPASAPAGGFTFGAPAAAAPPAPAAGGFSFGKKDEASESKKDDDTKKEDTTTTPAAPATGGFSFGTVAPAPAPAAAGKAPAPAFGGLGSASAASAPAPASTAGGLAGFSFGGTTGTPAPAAPATEGKKEEAPKPVFGFGTAASLPAAATEEPKNDEAPKPLFAFGDKSAAAPAPAVGGFGAPSAPSPAPPAAVAFGASSSTAPADDGRLKDERNPKKKRSAPRGDDDAGTSMAGVPSAPPFQFGGANTIAAPTLPPATGGFGGGFGTAAVAAPPAAAPATPTFGFGNAAPSAPTPPPAAAANPPAPGFTFGGGAPQAPAPAPAAGGAPFQFGAANAAAPPPAAQSFAFGTAAPAPPPGGFSHPGSQSTSPAPPAFGFNAAAAVPQQQQPAPGGFGAPAGFGAPPAPPAAGGFGAPPAPPAAGGFSIGTGGSSNQGGKQRRRIVRARRPPR